MTSPAAPLLEWLMRSLDEFLTDPATEDVCINKPGECFVFQRGVWSRHDVPLSLDDLEEIAILAGALRKQECGPHLPLLATELHTGHRLQVVLPPAVPAGTVSLSFRKHAATVAPLALIPRRYKSDGWHRWRTQRVSRDMERLLAAYDGGDLETFLGEAVRGRLNIILSGSTGSGKTALSRTLLSAIDQSDRVITIEDALELSGLPDNHARLLYSKEALSTARVDAESLLEASLRMRPDRIIVGELRDEAAWTWTSEVATGHPGAITSVHGGSAAEAFRRLFGLAKTSPKGAALDDSTLIDLISAAVDLIVPLDSTGGVFSIGSTWFVADAARRNETAADLLREA
jgi:type IV secretion system protein VirB11